MQRHGRANVPRHAVKTRAQLNLSSPFSFNHQMFLAVRNGLRVWQIQKHHARMRILRGNGFMAEIEAKAAHLPGDFLSLRFSR